MSTMDAAQKLLQIAPPADLDKNVRSFTETLKGNPDAKEALLKRYPMPFATYEPTEEEEKQGEKPFVLCRQNRIGDKHRSPWTGVLYPKPKNVSISDAPKHEDDELLLEIESKFNVVWGAYTKLYYGHEGVGSVFLTETDRGDLNGFFAIQKNCEEGSWSSMHFMTMEPPTSKNCTYRIVSHVLMVLNPEINGKESTTVDLSSYMTKDTTKTLKIETAFIMASHIENIGTIVEANEIDVRSNLERVNIPNTADATDSVQKAPEAPKAANPLMGMIMSSDVLKKKKIG